MRVVTCAGLTAAAVLLASIASAQGLGDVAAREKEKRKTAAAPKRAKVYKEADLGSASSTPASAPAAPAPAVDAAKATGPAGEAKPGEAKPGEKPAEDPEKAAAEAAARAEQEWRDKLGKARTDESNYQGTVDRLQASLTDTSSMYSPGWSAAMAELDKTKLKLAEVRAQITTLEEEGRRAGYR
jgi:hypothetical protein